MNELIVQMNQDKAGAEDAQCLVRVDGIAVGPMITVRAECGRELQVFGIRGDWSLGQHQLDVVFLNDLHDPKTGEDRNLYLQHARINGEAIKMGGPIKLSTNGECPPVGFEIKQHQYSIPLAFERGFSQLDELRAEVRELRAELREALAKLGLRPAIQTAADEPAGSEAPPANEAGQPPSPAPPQAA